MGGINYQTLEKIKNIKNDIGAGKELKDILKKYFTNSKNKLHKWLETNQNQFTGEELKYLEYVIAAEVITEDIDITPKPKENTSIVTNTSNIVVSNLTRKERENIVFSDVIIEKLLKLIQGEKEKSLIEIPKELRNLEDLKIQNVRVSGKIYKEFVSICKENNVTITDATNFMFREFIDKYKK
ncbi:hypothetical protein [Fusobacterium polymorphum]|uniref:hypothetical protein n=1 Tax=Fusobacterium nucleatum subsp. polymorphum TaxID=76857 RepID=UPI0030081DEC